MLGPLFDRQDQFRATDGIAKKNWFVVVWTQHALMASAMVINEVEEEEVVEREGRQEYVFKCTRHGEVYNMYY